MDIKIQNSHEGGGSQKLEAHSLRLVLEKLVAEPGICFGNGCDLRTNTPRRFWMGELSLSYALGEKSHVSDLFILSSKTSLMPQIT